MPGHDGSLWGFPPLKIAIGVLAAAAVAFALVGRPLTAPLPGTVKISDMTWVEVRGAIDAGYTRVIVPSGGIEQNGPHMILGKHDHIVAWTAERIAAELGRTLVTPVVSFVPEGSYAPPSGHMRFPGTLGVTEEVFAGVLDGIARSLKAGGFKTICFIADHGGSMKPQAEVAARLNREWAAEGIKVISVDDYYKAAGDQQNSVLEAQGETPSTIGQHAGAHGHSSRGRRSHAAGQAPVPGRAHGLRRGSAAGIRRARKGAARSQDQGRRPADRASIAVPVACGREIRCSGLIKAVPGSIRMVALAAALAAVFRNLHRRLRGRTLHVREQFSGRQGLVFVRRGLERVQAADPRRKPRGKDGALQRPRDELLPARRRLVTALHSPSSRGTSAAPVPA
jgi:creatinine amidohydrolase